MDAYFVDYQCIMGSCARYYVVKKKATEESVADAGNCIPCCSLYYLQVLQFLSIPALFGLSTAAIPAIPNFILSEWNTDVFSSAYMISIIVPENKMIENQ